jgi:hypothetical protein
MSPQGRQELIFDAVFAIVFAMGVVTLARALWSLL